MSAARIQQIYIALFNRPADPLGLDFWLGQTNQGTNLAPMLAALAPTAEYQDRFNGLTTAQQVNTIYQALFGRDADLAGLTFFVNQINSGALTLATLAVNILDGAQGTDATIIANKTTAATNFTTALDTTAEVLAYSGQTGIQAGTTYLSGVTTDAATIPNTAATDTAIQTLVTSAPGTGTPGTTFTLTTSLDNLTGAANNDTFIGDAATAALGDQIDGGAGTDTLKLFGNAAEPSHKNVEIIELTGNTAGFDVSDNASVTTLNLIDPTTAQTYTIANGQKVSLSNVAATEVVDFAGNSVTGLELTVSGVGTAASNATIDLNSTAQTSVTINSGATTSGIAIANTGGKLDTFKVTGSTAIDITHALTTVKTIDASATTGGVDIEGVGASDLTFTGGSGNDSINLAGTITKDDKIDGGAGTDVLELTQASVTIVQGLSATDKATLNTNLANLEVLKVTNALTSDVDASRFDGINSFVLAAGNNAGGTATISSVKSGVSVEIGDAAGAATNVTAISITDATKAGNNSDTVNLVLNDAVDGATDLGVVNLEGVDILNIEAKDATGGTANVYTLDIANTSTSLKTVTITGTADLNLSTVALTATIQTVDASAATGAISVAVATGGTTGVVLKGGSGAGINTLTGGDGGDVITSTGTGADVLTGNAGDDTITSGAGADTLTGNAGADVLTGGAGADIFNYDTTEAQIIGLANSDRITDFVAGTDKLRFGDDAGDIFAGQTVTAAVLGAAVTDTDAVETLADVLTQIGTGTALTAGGNLGATVYTFTTGAAAGTYLHINDDGSAAADAADILINITGINGTLTASDFSFV